MEVDGMILKLPEREPDAVAGVGAVLCCVPLTGDGVAEVWLCDPFPAVLVAPATAPLDVAAAVAGAKVPVEPSVLE